MIQLYYFHGATCGLKTRFTLSEKRVKYDQMVVEREYLRTSTYRKLNPNGVVPTLIHNGNIILESSIIMHYVNDAFEGPQLKPTEPLEISKMKIYIYRDNHRYW